MSAGQPLAWLGGQIDIKIEVATLITPEGGGAWDIGLWDSAVWSETLLAFADISDYVMAIFVRRGQERFDSRFTAGTATIHLNNTTGLFTPNAGEEPWSAPFRPGRLIRLVVIPDSDNPESTVVRFTGRIDSSNDVFTDAGGNIVTVLHAIDALGDLHDHNPPALGTATGVQSTDERITSALDNMGWPIERRQLQPGLHTMATSFLAQTSLEECQRAADAEGGLFYSDGDGFLVFKNRDWMLEAVASMEPFEDVVLATTPEAYWRMTGAATADISGNGHTLSWSGSPTTGAPGVTADDEAITLDGSSNFATITDEVDLESATDISIECWFNADNMSGPFKYLFSARNATPESLWELSWDDPDTILFGGSGLGFRAIGGFGHSEWHHVVATVETAGTDRITRIYRNGQLAGTVSSSNADPSGPFTVEVGRRAVSNDRYFPGDISELVFYNGVLTPTEVLQHYEAKDLSSNERSRTIQGYIGYSDDLPMEYAGEPTAEIIEIDTNWERHRVRNDIQFARDGGVLQQVEDTDSQLVNGIRSYSRRDFHNNSDAEVLTLAERNLAAYAEARPRIDTVTIVANDDPDNEDLNRLFWDVQFGDLLSVKVATLHGWSYTREVHVIGIEDEITANDWKVKLTLDDSIIEVLEALES